MKSLLQTSFVLTIGLLSACASSTVTSTHHDSFSGRNPSSVDQYTPAVAGKEYPVEKIAPTVLTEEAIETNHLGYWGPFSHARAYLKELSLKSANDAQKNPNELCAPYNTSVTLPAGKTWTVKDFTITAKPSCDIADTQLHCDTPYSATCVAN